MTVDNDDSRNFLINASGLAGQEHTGRAITVEEGRKAILNHFHKLVEYWDNESRAVTSKDKLDGLAFSILSFLDGSTSLYPPFKIVARNTAKNISYFKQHKVNYWPSNVDFGGMLHEKYYEK